MKTSNDWLQYFEHNRTDLLPIPWERGAELTPEERTDIARSVQEFQLGESSEGRHLLEDARVYAERTGDQAYLQAARLFIREEKRYASDLGAFLQLHGLPLARTTAADRAFRWLRNLCPGLELSIAVLVTGELIAKPYYSALRKATGSAILRTLCEQILRDEVNHIAFQSEQLARLRARRGRLGYALTLTLQALLYLAAVVFVGLAHRLVRRRAAVSWRGWWRACWREYGAAFSQTLRDEARLAAGSARSSRFAFSLAPTAERPC